MNFLEMKDIKKSFGSRTIIKGIDLDVKEGEVLVIIGPSGSGKSTLLRLATNLEEIDSGFIKYKNEYMCWTEKNGNVKYNEKKVLNEINKYYGFVFQNFNLFNNLSVFDNLKIGLKEVLNLYENEANEKVKETLDKLGLREYSDYDVSKLSGGQKQRVSIGRAVVMDSEIIFFDEPTSALDPTLTNEVFESIKKLKRENKTLVVVTHEMDFAKKIADRLIFMKDGLIIEQGSLEELENSKNIDVKKFLKS